jgi:predicted RNase H-like HicB family nuclease
MNKKAIAETAICRYDEKEHCYVVESPIFDRVVGAGETAEEAWHVFSALLDETYVAYLEGKLVGYEKRGRPAKGNVEFHAQVKPEVREKITAKARELGISQGEVIAYLNAAAEALPDLQRRYEALLQKAQEQECGDRESELSV